MNAKSIFIIILLALGGAALWWFTRPAAEAPPPAKIAEAPASLKSALNGPTPKLAQVEAPKVAPAVPEPQTEPTGTTMVNSTGDPRGDPTMVLSEARRLLESRDYIGFVTEFVPPEALRNDLSHGMTITQLAQKFDQGFNGDPPNSGQAHLMEALQSLEGRTPKVDASGEHATFMLDPPVEGWGGVNLVKINGLWYFPYE